MGRQRTIKDREFWCSPKMAGLTHEDRSTLTYLLTSPYSNIIGVYEIVPRLAASEMGWDKDSQLIPVLQRLSDAGFLKYDQELSFVWVKIWWEHNSAPGAVAPTLRSKTVDEIFRMPSQWRDDFVRDFLLRLPRESKSQGNLHDVVSKEIRLTAERVSIPCPYPIDSVSMPQSYPIDTRPGNSNSNYKYNSNSNSNSNAGSEASEGCSGRRLRDSMVVYPQGGQQ